MSIEIPLVIALIISISANMLGFYYIRDLVGRLGWLTQNMMTLNELIQGYKKHLIVTYELEQFYGDTQIKTLIEHTSDLVEVIEDYMDVGLDAELIESEEGLELSNEETYDKETQEE